MKWPNFRRVQARVWICALSVLIGASLWPGFTSLATAAPNCHRAGLGCDTDSNCCSGLSCENAKCVACSLTLTLRLDSCLQDELVLRAFIYPDSFGGGNDVQASFLSDLLNKINQVRASVSTKKHPVPPLLRILPLESAAQGYSQTLVGTDPTMLSHTLNGTPTDRAVSAGYDPTATVGENLAAGQWSAQEVINAWIDTPEAYANLINPQFTQVGLGLAGGSAGSNAFVLYWVADFGSSTQNYAEVGGTAGPAIGLRAVVAQLHSDLQMADAALCAGNIPALTSDLDQGFVNYWLSQNLGRYSISLSVGVGVCLNNVLGFYSSTNGADYTPATSYITTQLIGLG